MLVVGAETGQLFFLEPSGLAVKHQVLLSSVPVFIVCEGEYEVDFKVFVACRDGSVRLINA
jgi:Bardet-Biedl syndrome 1 protein